RDQFTTFSGWGEVIRGGEVGNSAESIRTAAIAVENANDAAGVACNKPEAQAKGIERYVFSKALRLRFRLVSPAGAPIQLCSTNLFTLSLQAQEFLVFRPPWAAVSARTPRRASRRHERPGRRER